MPADFHHGVRVVEVSDGARSITTIASAVIGLIATGPAADAATFPLDQAVLVTDIESAIAAAGTTGTLAAALQAISDQVSTPVVVVRVAQGADANATSAAVIGTDAAGERTGMQALLGAQSKLGVRPRILGAPGLDSQAVLTALAIVAVKLRGFVYGAGVGASVAEVITYRGQFSARELMLVWPDFTAFDVASATSEPAFAVARAMGLRAQIDQTTGWHKSLSNVPVLGVTGLSKDVHWDLQATGSDSDLLNAAGVTTLINSNGYRFWGNRTCSADDDFVFEVAVRTSQILSDTIADAMLVMVDKPLHPTIGRDIVESINAKFRSLVAQGFIIGGKAWLNTSLNDAATLKTGKLVIDYDYTPVPPLENLLFQQRITDTYLADFTTVATATVA